MKIHRFKSTLDKINVIRKCNITIITNQREPVNLRNWFIINNIKKKKLSVTLIYLMCNIT